MKTPRPLADPSLAPRHGRGAVRNVAHRFLRDEREAFDDGWTPVAFARPGVSGPGEDEGPPAADDTPPPLRTTVTAETARRLLAYNQSPDLPFDRALNPYRGCEHGCTYCYARPTHAYLGHSPGLDFETRLIAKQNAVAALRDELARPGYRPATIAIGSATDIYQPIEREWRLTRGILELMLETRHPAVLITKNALVERDIDVLAELARRRLVGVFVSITTLDAGTARTLEPRASAPWRRIEAVRRLAAAGIPTGVMVAPVIPFITDADVERVLEAAGEAGARMASYTILCLPYEVRAVFTEWLEAHYPDRAERVLNRVEDLSGHRDASGQRTSSRFGARMRGEGEWARLLAQRFALAARKAGFGRHPLDLDLTQFTPPSSGGQQQLF